MAVLLCQGINPSKQNQTASNFKQSKTLDATLDARETDCKAPKPCIKKKNPNSSTLAYLINTSMRLWPKPVVTLQCSSPAIASNAVSTVVSYLLSLLECPERSGSVGHLVILPLVPLALFRPRNGFALLTEYFQLCSYLAWYYYYSFVMPARVPGCRTPAALRGFHKITNHPTALLQVSLALSCITEPVKNIRSEDRLPDGSMSKVTPPIPRGVVGRLFLQLTLELSAGLQPCSRYSGKHSVLSFQQQLCDPEGQQLCDPEGQQ